MTFGCFVLKFMTWLESVPRLDIELSEILTWQEERTTFYWTVITWHRLTSPDITWHVIRPMLELSVQKTPASVILSLATLWQAGWLSLEQTLRLRPAGSLVITPGKGGQGKLSINLPLPWKLNQNCWRNSVDLDLFWSPSCSPVEVMTMIEEEQP